MNDQSGDELRPYTARALACLDLTSLNLDDTPQRIDALCDRALLPGPGIDVHPAAICIYPRFVAQVCNRIRDTTIAVAAVANFPSGDSSVGTVIDEVEWALRDGAHEIDVVLPFRAFLRGEEREAMHLVRMVSHVCSDRDRPATLKVILETGVLRRHETIAAAARAVIASGASFLKTSTGKLEPAATLEAAETMLEVIAEVRRRDGLRIGLKAAGGIATVVQAAGYLQLADHHFAPDEANPRNFRFGASGLLNDIVRLLADQPVAAHTDPSNY